MEIIRKHKNDILLIVLLLAVSLAALLYMNLTKEEAGEAVISVGGDEVARFSLSVNAEYKAVSENGYNVIIIEDGCAWVSEASCPDKVCMHYGKLQYDGQSAVCLPNKMILTVEGGISLNDAESK